MIEDHKLLPRSDKNIVRQEIIDNQVKSSPDCMLLTILEIVTEGVRDVLGDQESFDLGFKVVDIIRHRFGGENFYISKGKTMDSVILNYKVHAEFTNNNCHELSRKYDCSIQWIYSIVRKAKKIKRDQQQCDLFEVDTLLNKPEGDKI